MDRISKHPPQAYDYYVHTRTTRDVEDARLALQAVIGLEAEMPCLQSFGLEGKRVHCIGAGPCFYENELFRRVHPSTALASDIDQESISVVQSVASDPSISYKVIDATQTLPQGFNVVAERFLLIQLPNDVAHGVVNRMVDSLPPLGRVILTEFVNSFCITEPRCEALVQLRLAMIKRFRAHGADPDIGLQLEQFLHDAGVRNIAGYDISYRIQGPLFDQDIVIGNRSFGNPADIIGKSYAARFGAEYPELVREFQNWLDAARQPGSAYRLEHRYRIASGIKP
jgi:hypothetical protein